MKTNTKSEEIMAEILEITEYPMLETSTGNNKRSNVLIWFTLLVIALIVILVIIESNKEHTPVDA